MSDPEIIHEGMEEAGFLEGAAVISASQDDDIHARRLRLQDELRHRIERLLADPFVRRTLGMGPAGVNRPLRSRRKRPRLKPITTFHRGYVDAGGGDAGDAV